MDELFQAAEGELEHFRTEYERALRGGSTSAQAAFNYGWCLVTSRTASKAESEENIRTGLSILRNIADDRTVSKRDVQYFMALGEFRLERYHECLAMCESLLRDEPESRQVQQLADRARERIQRDGYVGIALTAAAVGAGAILLSFLKKR